MDTFWKLYDWSERTFWNSLTKKLMSFLLLFFIDAAYLGIYMYQKAAVTEELQRSSANAEVLRRIDASLDGGFYLMVALTVIALVWNVLQIVYLRYLIVRPIRAISAIFDDIARGEGDLSRNLPMLTHDELRTLAESYNRFIDKMRQIIGEVRKMSVNIAREAVIVKKNVTTTVGRAKDQREMTDLVFGASQEATLAIQNVSGSTEDISHSTEGNLERARAMLDEMQAVVGRVETVSGKLMSFNDTVGNLAQRSDSVRKIAGLIKDVADQTNLLALNAAIVAARAGEQGRGFAVVADEVRKLADQVNSATKEIETNITGMSSLVRDTQEENERINADIRQTREVVEKSSGEFERMVSAFERTSDQLNQIAAAMEQLTATNGQVHEAISKVHDLCSEVSVSMESSGQSTNQLTLATESVQELVSRFKIGHGAFDYNVEQGRAFRDAVQEKLAELSSRGIDIWDQRYRPINGTNPQKYEVGYLRAFETEVQPLLEKYQMAMKGGIFAILIDGKGYAAIHNTKFSKPLTGDYQTDLVGNRTRRIWEDPTGQRAAKNQEPLLVQTYVRDTGEILSEINMPIFVGGRYWGNVRVGCDSRTMLEG